MLIGVNYSYTLWNSTRTKAGTDRYPTAPCCVHLSANHITLNEYSIRHMQHDIVCIFFPAASLIEGLYWNLVRIANSSVFTPGIGITMLF